MDSSYYTVLKVPGTILTLSPPLPRKKWGTAGLMLPGPPCLPTLSQCVVTKPGNEEYALNYFLKARPANKSITKQGEEGLKFYLLTVQYKNHWPHVAIEYLKCG